MHILLGILSALGVVALIVWRLNQAAHLARDVGDAAEETRGLFRRWAWRRKFVNPIDQINDPREAASAMLVGVAQYHGAMREAEISQIRDGMMRAFGASRSQADELIAHGQWLTRGGGDLGTLFMKLLPVIDRNCGPKEKRELVEMLKAVAAVRAGHSDVPREEIERFDRRILPR